MSEEPRNIAKVVMDYKILVEMLHLPQDTVILGVVDDVDDIFGRKRLVLVVEHPDLPEHQEGSVLLSVSPTFITRHNPSIEFVSWQ